MLYDLSSLLQLPGIRLCSQNSYFFENHRKTPYPLIDFNAELTIRIKKSINVQCS
jgi:hypothetical protein